MRSPDGALAPAHAIALGLLQGPTELLPVSSSAHTTLLAWFARWPYARLDGGRRKSFEVVLHTGAGLALALSMRRELLREAAHLDRRRMGVVALSLAPAALAGYALGGTIERRLGGPRSIAAGLAVGAVAMAAADSRATDAITAEGTQAGAGQGRSRHDEGRPFEDARARDGLALGLAQAAALMPGVSRNGATLTVARARGFSRAGAQALSWHAGLPVIFGASALKAVRLRQTGLSREGRLTLALGAGSAFLSTLASARMLERQLREGQSLLPSSLYRCALAALVLARVRADATANAN
ncbi:MAG TPA: undecaprenyl-diphosphate phosphatase [Solirubrobacteraceae bacterium]|nr:undecaprenyl-diphosphate phosphatase [Solirubrobacteraceae bacterium]